MARKGSKGLYNRFPLSVIRAKRDRGDCPLVSRDMGIFSTSTYVHSYSSNIPDIPHRKEANLPLIFRTPLVQYQRGNASQPLETLEYSYIGQPQTIHPFPTTNISPHDWHQSASLPQDNLVPHPQSRARGKSHTLGVSHHAITSFGQPPETATMSFRREAVDKSGSQVTNLPPR